MGKTTVGHSFYCINCGKEGIPIQRLKGVQRGKLHRKKMYCINCREDVNHVECKNQKDIEDFKEAFLNGDFKEEAEESLAHTKERKEESY